MVEATERWSDRRYARGKSAAKAWDVVHAANEDEAVNAAGVPRPGEKHPLDGTMYAEPPEATREGYNYYVVRVSYGLDEGGQGGDQSETHPLNRRPRIAWDLGSTGEPFDRDIEGNPIVNSAGDAFDPPPNRDFISVFFTLSRYEQSFDGALAIQITNCVNSTRFNVMGMFYVEIGQARLVSMKPTHDYDAGAEYIEVAYQFEARFDGHQLRILDQGQRAIYTNADDEISIGEIFDGDGNQVSSPVLLNGGGAPLNDQYKVANTDTEGLSSASPPLGSELETTESACFLKYKRYPAVDFNLLGFRTGQADGRPQNMVFGGGFKGL
jgi:hypothetical protein